MKSSSNKRFYFISEGVHAIRTLGHQRNGSIAAIEPGTPAAAEALQTIQYHDLPHGLHCMTVARGQEDNVKNIVVNLVRIGEMTVFGGYIPPMHAEPRPSAKSMDQVKPVLTRREAQERKVALQAQQKRRRPKLAIDPDKFRGHRRVVINA